MKFDNIPLINQSSAVASSLTSSGIDLGQQVNCSLVATFAGSPSLSFIIEVSNDAVPVAQGANPGGNVVNWAPLQAPVSVTTAGSTSYNFPNIAYRWLRVRTTGTSTGGAIINYCGQGA